MRFMFLDSETKMLKSVMSPELTKLMEGTTNTVIDEVKEEARLLEPLAPMAPPRRDEPVLPPTEYFQ